MTYLMALLHSLVDGLRFLNKRCHEREGVTLRPWYLSFNDNSIRCFVTLLHLEAKVDKHLSWVVK